LSNADDPTKGALAGATDMNPFSPPIIRSASGVLDRALFSKTVSLAAAAVFDKKKISAWRGELQSTRELLVVDRLQIVRPHPDQAVASQGTKCLLLDPKVKIGGKMIHIRLGISSDSNSADHLECHIEEWD
jgi:tRNA (guanine37-N1)-methyltransferase